ncbi:uncharacterized protein [Cicer arietinum]|uniref:Uncharacterized protein LOC101494287 isoform X1 n=1 Tax=Cicer arietinum TaxID=3827 RepID=A0A1S2YC03_CICAR|nr:uncharacterized protein LOC101494287 isoform X1 [Cicer arietinum]
MRKKSVCGGRRRSTTPSVSPLISPIPPLSTSQDDNIATIYDSDTNTNTNDDHTHAPLPDTEPVESFDDNTCITCNQSGGPLLVCAQTDCPVTVHVTCIGSEPKFDYSGKFYCPYCSYKRALNKSRELREKVILAKKALSSFLEKDQTLRKDKDHQPVQPVQDHANRDDPVVSHSGEGKQHNNNDHDLDRDRDRDRENENDKGKISVTSSSVSETNDSDSNSIAVKKGYPNAKRKVVSVKKTLLWEQKTGGASDVDDEEVTSSRTLKLQKQNKNQNLLTGKRRRLFWTAEEEKTLKEGVLKFSTGNQNIPWRKILEFGCRVFDNTRTPVDLKDKWRNMTSKEGN